MKVSEIFLSIEGEGKRVGTPCVFIRLYGCNLRCSYCDSLYAVEGKDFQELSVNHIIKEVKKYGIKNITLTGGEPLIHKDVNDLINKLISEKFFINVETNGTVKPTIKGENIFYTVDWKSPSSMMMDKMNLSAFKNLSKNDVIKFVVGNIEDLLQAESVIQRLQKLYNDEIPSIFISPIFNQIDNESIVNFILHSETLKKQTRFQIQLHKIIWNPEMRGV